MVDFRNAQYNAHGTIDVELNHPVYGWIPFTATPKDSEELGRLVYAEALKGPVAPYTPPPPPTPEEIRATMPVLERAQVLLALDSIEITEEMVDAALAGDRQGMIEWKNRLRFRRDHYLIDSLGTVFGLPPEQIDTLWLWAADL